MAISKRLRYEILARDNNTCRYCHATDTPLHIDHVTPTALGGTDDPANLVAACKDCNAGKSSSHPDAATVAQVSDDAVRWASAMQLAAERITANKAEVSEQLKPWFDQWHIRSGPGWAYKLPSDAETVLRDYVAAGMPVEFLVDAARIALRKRGADSYWHYFQGVAKNMLRDLQRDAAAILAQRTGTSPDQPADERFEKGFIEGYKFVWRKGDHSLARLQLRSLSQVVDGHEKWNRVAV